MNRRLRISLALAAETVLLLLALLPPPAASPVGRLAPGPVLTHPPGTASPLRRTDPTAPPAHGLPPSLEGRAASPASSLGLRPGLRLAYTFSIVRRIDATGPDADRPGSGRPYQSAGIDITLAGRLLLDVESALCATSPAGWKVAFRLSPFTFSSQMGPLPAYPDIPALEDEMSRSRIEAELSALGQIGNMRATGLETVEARTLWKEILAGWQVVLPDDPDSKKWTHRGHDATGAYVAHYRRRATAFPQRITRRRACYESLSAQEQPEGVNFPNTIEGETVIELNPYPLTISGREDLVVTAAAETALKSRTDFSYTLCSIWSGAVGESLVRRDVGTPLDWGAETADASFTSARTGPIRLPSLEKLLDSGQTHDGREAELAGAWVEAIRAHETELVPIIEAALSMEGSPGERTATLTGLLGAAGTPESQLALLELAESADQPDTLRSLALQSLVQVTDPIGEMDLALMGLCEDSSCGDSAFLVLAAMGERLRERDPVRREAISLFILDRVERTDTTDEGQVLTALAAVENLGPAKLPALVTKMVTNDHVQVRRQALACLEHRKP